MKNPWKYMKAGFFREEDAVSPVIGAILILAVGVTVLANVQLNFVPVWNAALESQHLENVYADMMLLSSNIEITSGSGVTRTADLNMGFRYPDRPLLANPKSAVFGKLSADSDLNVNITITQTGGNKHNYTYKVSTLRYEMPGDHAAIVYEHGAIIRDYSSAGGRSASSSRNIIAVENDINIPFLMSSSRFDRSSSEPVKIILSPLVSSDLNIGNINSVNISMDTHYADVWRMIFGITYNQSADKSCVVSKIIIGNLTDVCITNNNRTIFINSTATKEVLLPEAGSMAPDRFYAGISSFRETETKTTLEGGGTEGMASGVLWYNVPEPGSVSRMIITNITLDPYVPESALADDTILFKVTDLSGNFWIVEIDFTYSSAGGGVRQINAISLRTATGRSSAKTSYLNTFDNFDSVSSIDLFDQSNYNIELGSGGAYQNSSMGPKNILVSVWLGDKKSPFEQGGTQTSPLVFYNLMIE